MLIVCLTFIMISIFTFRKVEIYEKSKMVTV